MPANNLFRTTEDRQAYLHVAKNIHIEDWNLIDETDEFTQYESRGPWGRIRIHKSETNHALYARTQDYQGVTQEKEVQHLFEAVNSLYQRVQTNWQLELFETQAHSYLTDEQQLHEYPWRSEGVQLDEIDMRKFDVETEDVQIWIQRSTIDQKCVYTGQILRGKHKKQLSYEEAKQLYTSVDSLQTSTKQ